MSLQDMRNRLALLWGVPPNARWTLWLWRAFVRPAEASEPWLPRLITAWRVARPVLLRLIVGSGRVIDRVLMGSLWPVRLLIAGLDRLALHIHVEPFIAKADRWLLPALRVPLLSGLLLLLLAGAMGLVVSTPFNWAGQMIFMLLCWSVAMVLRRLPGRYPALALAALSLIAMARYAWWRLTSTLEFNSNMEALLGYGLLAAESYTWLVVMLGFIQTAWPLNRQPAQLDDDPASWPTVDVFIPTYNEALTVVRPTALAALAMDWPKDKLRVYILDDGRREAFREFAASIGIGYMIRSDNRHAKAGNLNHALRQTDGELVAIFDCDHIPTRSFLKTSVGWFRRDPKCAMLQTPHHFFSPDPFERNLETFRRVPNEGALFYGLIQDGNDFWNSTFFCGSCAVIRRAPLMEIGGVAVETVTEDAHTALKLHRRGYATAYINQTQAAGLATESLSAHVGQRIRWARGMAQIFRLDNPFLGAGLTIWQRICYANAMLHFFFGLPRLVFLTAPMAYLFFEWHIINAGAFMLALYVVPYILQSNLATAHMQGEYRHTFWAEVYETVLAWYVALPTTMALINPRAGSFNVTAKGGLVEKAYFDWTISKPYMVLVGLNFLAFGTGLLRLFVWNSHEVATVLLNQVWTLYSILMLGAAIGVASETKQVRRTHRVVTRLPAALYLRNGRVLSARCEDYSMTGLGLRVPGQPALAVGDNVHVSLWRDGRECAFAAQVIVVQQDMLGLQLQAMSHAKEIDWVQCTFARAEAWVGWSDAHDKDRPLQGLKEITQLGLAGYEKLWATLRQDLRATWQRLLEQSRRPA